MLRFALFGCFMLALGPVTADEKKDVPKELAPFQGTWKIVEATADGKPIPKEAIEKATFTFDGTKLSATETGDKTETGSYTVDPKKEPATIDLVSPKGETAPGIYKFDKDGRLTISFIKGKDAARPKGFDDKGAVTMVLEKVKK